MTSRPLSRLLLLVGAAVLCALTIAVPSAQADSIAYVKDGNVWLASADGQRQFQVTTTGGYSDVSQADDGTMIALNGIRLHRLARDGKVLADFDTPVSDTRPAGSRVFYGPFDPAISPDGTKVAYTYYYMTQSQSPTCFPPQCVTAINEGGTAFTWADRQTGWDDAALPRHSGWRFPAWVDNDTTLLANPTHLPNHDVVVHTLSAGKVGLVKNWFSDVVQDNKGVGGGDVTRDRRKLAFQTGENDSSLTLYAVPKFPTQWTDSKPPEDTKPVVCYRYGNADGGKFSVPTFSPDGGQVAWSEGNGVHVASVPSFDGGCTADGASASAPLVIPGASNPDWGPADVPAPRPVDPGPPQVDPRADVVTPPAARLSATVGRATVARALRNGLRVSVTAPGAGKLSAVATRGGKTVAKAAPASVKAGKKTLTLRFTKAGRRALRRAKAASLAVRVTFAPKGGKAETTRLTAKLG